MKVLILAEYYPRASDPTLGVWAHRQAVAARDAGAEVRVLVLHRPLPTLADMRGLRVRPALDALRQPASVALDGIPVEYVRYVSPPRPLSYASWGAWAAPCAAPGAAAPADPVCLLPGSRPLRRAGRRRSAPGRAATPLIVSVHGGDVHGPHAGTPAVARTLRHARLVLANSAGTARRCEQRGAARTRVVHLGTDVPVQPATPRPTRCWSPSAT